MVNARKARDVLLQPGRRIDPDLDRVFSKALRIAVHSVASDVIDLPSKYSSLAMDQKIAIRRFVSHAGFLPWAENQASGRQGVSALLHGAAGCGKSFAVGVLCGIATAAGLNTQLLGTTAQAAR